MKLRSYSFFLLSFLLSYFPLTSQIPSWSWAHSGAGGDIDMSYAITTDSYGNSYIAGSFESATTAFGTYTLTNAQYDSTDVFITKYDINGNVQWAHSAGGLRNEEATSVAADINGDIIVTGYFYSDSITFGSYTLYNTNGYSDIFVAKYDQNGNVAWAGSYGGNYDDRANGIATDNTGNFVITGYFLADTLFTGPNAILCAGSYDMFVAKFNSAGSIAWARSEGTSNDDRGQSIATDQSGNVIAGGTFRSSPLIIGNDTMYYAGGAYSDLFIVKYDYLGNHVWAFSEGGTYLDETNGLTTDPAGNIFMAAIVYSSSIVIGSDTLSNSGSSFYCEVVIAKYDDNGNALWAQNHGVATGNDIAYGITTDMFGDPYITGIHGANIVFGTYTLSNTGMFVVKYEGFSGIVQWATHVTDAYPYGISSDNNFGGDIVVSGFIYGPAANFGSTTLSTSGMYDAFVARMDQSLEVAEPAGFETISVFPNPAKGVLLIDGLTTSEKYSVSIVNTMGETVRQQNVAGDNPQINCSDLPAGMYLVTVTGNISEEQFNCRIVIEQ